MASEELTLRKLEILVSFLKHGNLASTAEDLELSTVSVHRALHSLEDVLQFPLFRHEGRVLKPLQSARLLGERAQLMLRELEESIRQARAAVGCDSQQVRLGTLYSLTVRTMPQLIARLKARGSPLSIQLSMGSNDELLLSLRSLQLDAAVIEIGGELNTQGLHVLPLFDDPLYLASPPGFVPPDRLRADLRDYRDEKFLALGDGFATYRSFRKAFAGSGFQPEPEMLVSDIFSLGNLIHGGVGHALLPGRVRPLFEDRMQFLPLLERYQVLQRIGLVYLANRGIDASLETLSSALAECGRELG